MTTETKKLDERKPAITFNSTIAKGVGGSLTTAISSWLAINYGSHFVTDPTDPASFVVLISVIGPLISNVLHWLAILLEYLADTYAPGLSARFKQDKVQLRTDPTPPAQGEGI